MHVLHCYLHWDLVGGSAAPSASAADDSSAGASFWPMRNPEPRRSGSWRPTKDPPFFAHSIRINVAKRMLVYCGASGRTGKPIAWMRTRRTPSSSSRLITSTPLMTESIDDPVNSSPNTYKLIFLSFEWYVRMASTIPSIGLEFENAFQLRRRSTTVLRCAGVSGIHLPRNPGNMYVPSSFMTWKPLTCG